MTHLFTIQDDTVIINKLSVSEIHSNLAIKGNIIAYGSVNINGDLSSREITADVLRVKKLISETTDFGNWHAKTFDELNGKGITWNCDAGSVQLIYRTGNRIWTNSNFDLSVDSSYMIDNIPVLSSNSLGQTITRSNLRQVGALTALSVIGTASLGGFAFFDETTARLGLGTDEPTAAISILDNNVEITIGSPASGLASIGTHSNHDIAFISDNTARMTIKNSGEIHISDQISKSGVLRVFGSIYADSIVSDVRINRSSSVEFTATKDNNIYDKGLEWNTTNYSKKLVLIDNPSRVWTSESIDIANERSYFINGDEVLTSNALGLKVINSSLVTLGKLTELTVNGSTWLNGSVTLANPLTVDAITVSTVSSNDSISILANNTDVMYATATEIIVGSTKDMRRPVKVFGPLSIGISNPDPTVSLSVNGTVSFNNKKFVNSVSIPSNGSFCKGDICWNENPTTNGYVGWICIQSGTPGEWKPFGLLGA
jgi:hypothetical protein